MQIIIENRKPYDEKFIKWLVKQIKAKLFSAVNISLLKSLNDKLSDLGIEINIEKSFIYIVNHVTYVKSKFNYYIFIDGNKVIPGTKYKYIDVVKLINYGTIEILGYPIFSDVFNEININLDKYLEHYILAVGVI